MAQTEIDTDAPVEAMLALAWAVATDEGRPAASRVLERAYASLIENGRRRDALAIAVRLVAMSEERASSRGWEQRALRLAAEFEPCLERGYLAVASAGCDVADPRELQERAELARGIAEQFADRDLAVRALAELGLALVSQGRVADAFALLDEAAAAVLAGEVSEPMQRGLTICAMFSACQRTGDVARADYWCRRAEEEPLLRSLGIIGQHCALVRGDMDAMCGRWELAEQCFDAARTSPPGASARAHTMLATAHLAELRVRQGRYDDAAALLRGHEDEFDILPVLARLRAIDGQYDQAAALLRSYIRGLGADVIRRGPVLAQLVDLQLRRGDVAGADETAQRLIELDETCSSNEIRALARLALARIALHREQNVQAIDELETGLTLLIHFDRPLLTAELRLELARALAQNGDHGAARVEAEAALATFTRLRVAPEATATRELLLALERSPIAPAETAGPPPRHPQGGTEALTRREQEIADLVAVGLTNREIARRLFLSVRTVETHVDRALGKLGYHTRTQLAAWVTQDTGRSNQSTSQ
jgi:DNA-binding CsgD family transcriptional regulator/tetratricopeptide (TPR) repeat protein